MLTIQLNGSPHECEAPLTIAGLLQRLGLQNRRVAVEVNARIVPRSQHDQTDLQDADRVEIVHAIGGG
jgi:sulfur carrier protein